MNARPLSATDPAPVPPIGPAEAARRWADWVTIWQSEMAAMAADREVQEAVQRGVDHWAAQTTALGRDGTAGPAGAVSQAWPASALAPSGPHRPD